MIHISQEIKTKRQNEVKESNLRFSFLKKTCATLLALSIWTTLHR